jgi:hypothetical protein
VSVAFLSAYFGNTSDVKHPGTRPGTPQDSSKVAATVPVPKGAEAVAARYVLATMTRQNMARSPGRSRILSSGSATPVNNG